MKIHITESQLKKIILMEQIPDSRFGPERFMSHSDFGALARGDYKDMSSNAWSDANKAQSEFYHGEGGKFLFQITISQIPIIGPYLGAASLAYDFQSDYRNAKTNKEKTNVVLGYMAGIAIGIGLHFVCTSVAKLGVEGMATLSSKLKLGQALTGTEIAAVNEMSSKAPQITKLISEAPKKLSPYTDLIKQYKPQYIKKYGVNRYDELLGSLLTNKIPKEEFITSLKLSQKSSLEASFVSKAGIKFASEETQNLKKIANNISGLVNGDDIRQSVVLSVKGEKKSYSVIYYNWEDYTWIGLADRKKGSIYLNAKYLENATPEKIEEVLFHEASHIKDPAHVSPKLEADYVKVKKNITSAEKVTNFFWDNYLNVKSESSLKLVGDAKKSYEYWFNRYKFHTKEIIANNNMILNRLSPNTQELMGQIGPKQTKLALDNILNVARGTDKINDNGIKLLGSEGVGHVGALQGADKVAYQKFMKDLYKQVSYLESQLNLLQ